MGQSRHPAALWQWGHAELFASAGGGGAALVSVLAHLPGVPEGLAPAARG